MAAPVVLTIAGSDSSAGAGVQADIVTFVGEDVSPRCAVTLLTAQNRAGVRDCWTAPAAIVAAQIGATLAEASPAATKTGALGSAETVRVVAECARAGLLGHLVVDPVTTASAGGTLLDEAGAAALVEELVPVAAVTTPNLVEVSRWVGRDLSCVDDVLVAAPALRGLGPGAVVVTGGHLAGDPVDVVVTADGTALIEGPRITAEDTHGTGCVHSAALCARLARGDDVVAAAHVARRAVEARLLSRYPT
ncbi:MAG: bifunctional hydroxymethylpyrimidine kinase/phosphomethylpyrimidine kinase [Acidimicrobiia bacterium]|nr:bifunctional hydroxymethylpyrimidine kinase/phosphomethylpyrimidine kinase [Acidimicrobiia bacterium]